MSFTKMIVLMALIGCAFAEDGSGPDDRDADSNDMSADGMGMGGKGGKGGEVTAAPRSGSTTTDPAFRSGGGDGGKKGKKEKGNKGNKDKKQKGNKKEKKAKGKGLLMVSSNESKAAFASAGIIALVAGAAFVAVRRHRNSYKLIDTVEASAQDDATEASPLIV